MTLYALSQRTEARQQAPDSKANELLASADAELERDPELSIVLAREAARVVPSESSQEALRRALLQSRGERTWSVGEPLLGRQDAWARPARGDGRR